MKEKFLALLTIAVLLISCGPSVEGEKEDWTENLKNMETLKTKYPSMSEKIGQTVEAAKLVLDQAETIADEDEKAKKMDEANNLLETGCVGNLYNLETKISSVKSKISSTKSLLKRKKKQATKKAIRKADDAIDEAEDARLYANRIKNSIADEEITADEQCVRINKAFHKLTAAHSNLKNASSKLNKKEKSEKKK
jgi:hypothetical protein